MSGSFTGFSEDDIRKLTNPKPAAEAKLKTVVDINKHGKPVLRPQKRTSNNHQSTDELRNKILNEKIQKSPVGPIIEGAKLNKTPTMLPTHDKPQDSQKNKDLSSVENVQVDAVPKSDIPEPETNLEVENKCNESETEKTVVLVDKKLDLDEFQAKQKLMEEQNRKRKELLVKALAVKTKQTQEETQRLNRIREEFKKLDDLLSNDVKILRKQIEVASLDYMEAQKRYFRVEKEFLETKLILHQKQERKEMLTEHLCTIIEKNEERKAEKLNELLSKLNLNIDMSSDNMDNPQQTVDSVNQTDKSPEIVDDNVKSDNPEKE